VKKSDEFYTGWISGRWVLWHYRGPGAAPDAGTREPVRPAPRAGGASVGLEARRG
jgi:hypothetical protein